MFIPQRWFDPLPPRLRSQLRTGRTMRQPRRKTKPEGTGQLAETVHFSQRPDEAEDRAVVGHWEGVLVLGTQPSAVASVVDRASRYLVLAALHGRHGATQLRAALGRTLAGLSPDLLRSLTWDNGKEMAQHARIAADLGMGVFFTDPHSPWQRGSNENANGLLRQYLPKGTDISDRDQRALDAIAAKLNRRPRRVLGYRSPAEVLTAASAGG